MKKTLLTLLVIATLGVGALVAHASIWPAQLQQFQLCGSGASTGATSICIQSFKDISGNNLAMSSFGTLGFGTIEPGNGAQEESIEWTGVTQNANGTASLTGVVDCGLLQPFATTSGITFNHAGAVTFVVSNTSCFYNRMFSIVDNVANITGQWNFTNSGTIPTITGSATTSLQATNLGLVNSLIATATSSAQTNLLASNNSWTGTQTWSQNNINNGAPVFNGGATFQTVAPNDSVTPTQPNNIANKSYVDSVAIQGAPVAGNTATGTVMLATQLQAASSTASLGYANAAQFVLPASIATSTCANTTAALRVVVTTNAGTIDPSCIGGGSVPVGGVIPYSGPTVPSGFLAANGQSVSATIYSGLFSVIGNNFGTVASGFFNLPTTTVQTYKNISVVATSSAQTTTGTSLSTTITLPAVSATGTMILVGFVAPNTTVTVTDNGVAMTNQYSVANTTGFFYDVGTTSASHTISATWGASSEAHMAVAALTGVNTGQAVESTTTAASGNASIAPLTPASSIFSIVRAAAGTILYNATTTTQVVHMTGSGSNDYDLYLRWAPPTSYPVPTGTYSSGASQLIGAMSVAPVGYPNIIKY